MNVGGVGRQGKGPRVRRRLLASVTRCTQVSLTTMGTAERGAGLDGWKSWRARFGVVEFRCVWDIQALMSIRCLNVGVWRRPEESGVDRSCSSTKLGLNMLVSFWPKKVSFCFAPGHKYLLFLSQGVAFQGSNKDTVELKKGYYCSLHFPHHQEFHQTLVSGYQQNSAI